MSNEIGRFFFRQSGLLKNGFGGVSGMVSKFAKPATPLLFGPTGLLGTVKIRPKS